MGPPHEVEIFHQKKGKNMTLRPGQHAPPFQTMDMSGRNISLADYKDKRLLLSFFRYAS